MTSKSHGNEKEQWDGPTNTQDRQPDKVYNSQRNAQTHNKISFAAFATLSKTLIIDCKHSFKESLALRRLHQALHYTVNSWLMECKAKEIVNCLRSSKSDTNNNKKSFISTIAIHYKSIK